LGGRRLERKMGKIELSSECGFVQYEKRKKNLGHPGLKVLREGRRGEKTLDWKRRGQVQAADLFLVAEFSLRKKKKKTPPQIGSKWGGERREENSGIGGKGLRRGKKEIKRLQVFPGLGL